MASILQSVLNYRWVSIMSLSTAFLVLSRVRAAYPLGSNNIGAAVYSNATDSYQINQAFIGLSAHSRQLRSLLDPDITLYDLVARSRNDFWRAVDNGEYHIKKSYITSSERRRVVRQILAEQSSRRGAGNCEEMSTYAFLQIEEEILSTHDPGIIQNELMYVGHPKEIEHVFVVLNRPPNSNEHWQSWGSGAIILDPWINRVFFASDFFNVWKCFNPFGYNPNTWEVYTQFNRTSFWS